nr:hypothetical protein [Tanacetum cinerariifolium]
MLLRVLRYGSKGCVKVTSDAAKARQVISTVWGCREVVRLPGPKLKTLGERGIECIFVRYVEHSKAFRFYVIEPNESVSINPIIESRNAIFDENRFLSVSRPSQRSQLNRTRDIGGTRDELSDQHSYCFNVEDDPKTFNEAMKSQDVTFWKEAINDEIDSIMRNNTWVLADLPPGCKPLGCKWIFKRKLKYHKTVDCYGINSQSDYSSDGYEDMNGDLDEEAPKQWHQKFDEVVLSNDYLLNQADKCVYSKFDEISKGVIICLYVDDMLIFGTVQVWVDLSKEFLSTRFSMKDMGEAGVIFVLLWIQVRKMMPNNGHVVSQLEYSRVIGFLMYVMTCTRPDNAFDVGKLSRYTSNPGTQHWQAIQLVLKYLKKTMDYRLTYTGYPSVLEGYTDASWISNTEDNSSTSGWAFLLGGGVIFWAFKKQTCITGSTMESEFVALAAAVRKLNG